MMISELVFKRPCSRCPAVSEVPVSVADVKKGVDPSKDRSREVHIQMAGQTVVKLDNLCDACEIIVVRYISAIAKQLEKKSSVRERSSGEETGGEEVGDDRE